MGASKKRSSSFVVSDDDSTGEATASLRKQAKRSHQSSSNGTVQKDDQGSPYFDLKPDGTRRVTISEFKGKTMVNVREYYEKDGQKLPGKKGISLTMEQFNMLVEYLPDIESVLQGKGIRIPRPNYSGEARHGGNDTRDDNDEEEEQGKANYEATSDEDE